MSKWGRLLRHDWPLHLVLLVTNWLPDNVIFLRLRGFLARPFLGACGADLRLARNVSLYNPSRIQLGAHVYLAYGVAFIAGTERIAVGDEVIAGPYCVFASNNHTRRNGSFRYGPPTAAPIVIGRGVWLGAHVVVTAGATIEDGSLIAAGAVVKGRIPADTLAGGMPARVISPLVDE